MAKVRVYTLAQELGVESRQLISRLQTMGHDVRSASTVVNEAAVRQLRGLPPGERDALAASTSEPEGFDRGYADPWDVAADVVTASEGARLCDVKPETIRQWVIRGHLTAVDKRGRSPLYATSELRRVAYSVSQRTKAAPGQCVHIGSRDLDALVSSKEAARIVGISASTVRAWVGRGHLTPAVANSCRPLFKVVDVLSAARRPQRRRPDF